jgi:hypothetical protein
MRVSSWKFMAKSEVDTDCVFGLYLGTQNRHEFFNGLTEARVEIDGTVYVFSLARKSFWTTCPELRDKDTTGTPIRDLLERHNSLTWPKGSPKRFEMVPLGDGRFRLQS